MYDMADLKFMTDYHASFNPNAYLQVFYKTYRGNADKGVFLLKAFHKLWSSLESTGLRCLEYGGGPSIANLVSASPKVERIVFAEYTEANREAVKSWIAGNPGAHDWSSLLNYVVRDLEGDKTLGAVSNRTQDLKHKIKSIVPCDVTKRPLISFESDDIGKPFDVISTSLCLETCVSSEQQYRSAVAELCKLLKPGGYLFMYGVLEETFYSIGKDKFSVFPLTESMLEDAMTQGGLHDIYIQTMDTKYIAVEEQLSDCRAMFAACGKKSSDYSKN